MRQRNLVKSEFTRPYQDVFVTFKGMAQHARNPPHPPTVHPEVMKRHAVIRALFDKFLELTGKEKSALAAGAGLPASTVTQLYADDGRIASGSTIASIVLAYDLEITAQRRGQNLPNGATAPRCDPEILLAAIRTLWLRHGRATLPETGVAHLTAAIYNWIVDHERRHGVKMRDPAAILDMIGPFADQVELDRPRPADHESDED